MFKDARIKDRVWSFSNGWGKIERVDVKHICRQIKVRFDNNTVLYFTKEGKFQPFDEYPSLFWNEIKFEIPEKPFDLEDELRKLEITEFRHGKNNHFLTWSNEFDHIDTYYFNSYQNPFLICFTIGSLNSFKERIKDKNITKEQFFEAYKKVFGGL